MAKKNARTSKRFTQETFQFPFITLGTVGATAEDTARLDLTGRSYDAPLVSAVAATGIVKWEVPYAVNIVELMFALVNNNDDATVDIWAARGDDQGGDNDSDDLRLVCKVVMIAGQQTNAAGLYICDTLTISENNWHYTVEKSAPGTDIAASLKFDLAGYGKILIASYGTQDSILTVYGAGF